MPIMHHTTTAKTRAAMWRNIVSESSGFGVAELTSMATSLGVVAVADQIVPKPILKAVTGTLGKVIEPYLLDPMEFTISHLCHLDACKIDTSKPRQERAEQMAKVISVFGAAWVLSMYAKLHTRRFMNNLTHIVEELPASPPKGASLWEHFVHHATLKGWSPQEKMIIAADESIHYGSLLLLNTKYAAPVTDRLLNCTSDVLQKTAGVSKEKADELSAMTWVWEAPNFLGAIAGITAIAGKHLYNWPSGKIGAVLGKKTAEVSSHATHIAAEAAMRAHNSPAKA